MRRLVVEAWAAHSGENHQKDDQLDRDERRDDEEDCEQMLIDELHVRQVVARIAIPLHFPAKGACAIKD